MDDACRKKHRQIPYLWTWEGSYSTKDAVKDTVKCICSKQQSTFYFVTRDGLGKPSTSNLFVPLDHLFSHINSAKHIQDAFEIELKPRKLATLNADQSNNEITRKTCGTAEGLKLLCLLQIRLSLQVPRKNRNDCKHKQKFSGYGKSFFKSGRLDQPRAEAIWRGPERTFQPIARAALSDAWDGVKQPGSSCACDALPPTLKKNGGYCCLKRSKTGQHLLYIIK